MSTDALSATVVEVGQLSASVEVAEELTAAVADATPVLTADVAVVA